MPVPKGAKTGYDYSSLKQTHNSSDLQRKDNNTFQTIKGLIEGAEKFQGFINEQFPQLDGSSSSLLNAVREIQSILQDRQNSKYVLSITNSAAISVPGLTETIMSFDLDELNDGLMHWKPDEVRINDNAAWHIYGRVVFCSPSEAEFKVTVKVNGEPQIPSAVTGSGEIILPFVGTKELLRNDIVTLTVLHTADGSVDVLPTLQMHRLTWVANENASGRRIPSIADDAVCTDGTADQGGGNTETDCPCAVRGALFAVYPGSQNVHFLNKEARIIAQTPKIGTIPPVTDKISTFCAARKGTFLVLIDDVTTGFSRVEEYKPDGTFIRKIDLSVLLGQGPTGGYHSLMEEPCDFILTVDRTTHAVTEYDLEANITSRILNLTLDPFDGAINSKGNRLVYANGTILGLYDLAGDQPLADIIDFGFPISWPTWLADCSIIVFNGVYLTNGDFRVVDLDGSPIITITYDPTIFPGGLIGYAASEAVDRLWIVGLDATGKPLTLVLLLSDGSVAPLDDKLTQNPVPFNFLPTFGFGTTMVSSIYYPVKCPPDTEV